MARTAILERAAVVRHGRRLEYFTIAWNALESLVAVVAGAIAGSISLVGFGIDSFIEVTYGSVLRHPAKKGSLEAMGSPITFDKRTCHD